MNQKNYQYLSDSMEKMGFGNVLNNALKTKLELGFDEFELKAKTRFGTDVVQYDLKFQKGKSPDVEEHYLFLNRVKTTLTKQNGKTMTQEFPLFKQNDYTKEQMYNMLENRPIYKIFRKDGEKIGRWVKLDFNNKDENGNASIRPYYDNVTNFSLEREIGKLNLYFANRQEKEDMIRDLQNGELVAVSIRTKGKNEDAYVSVAPQIGGLILFNSEMKEVKRTDCSNVELVPDDSLKISSPTPKNTETKEQQLPEATKQLMEKANTPGIKEGQQAKRKIS
ncbi:MAG: hypothetical protein E6Q24_04745 [Chitinophagaceae bacterium]|nr:MAG: hypothetical protein E6Q24_04745 [Chitinophagaceae bacterium]